MLLVIPLSVLGFSAARFLLGLSEGGNFPAAVKIPDFLNKRHGPDLMHLGPPLVVIYLMTDVGIVGGGWLSSLLIKRGWTINARRNTALLVCFAFGKLKPTC
jgi:MFS family permease